MLNNVIAKIKSAPKLREVLILTLAVLIGTVAIVRYMATRPEYITLTNADLSTYQLEIADTPEDQAKGLSDRKTMPADHGMLFRFSGEGKRCFWMKDTHFPLDIIWLDEQQKVVATEQNVSPKTYPKQYCGNGGAMFVIELNAGQFKNAKMEMGDTLNF